MPLLTIPIRLENHVGHDEKPVVGLMSRNGNGEMADLAAWRHTMLVVQNFPDRMLPDRGLYPQDLPDLLNVQRDSMGGSRDNYS